MPAARPSSTPAASPRPPPHLKALWGGYALRDDIAKDAARMLLTIAIKDYNPKDVIVYFEVLKEKDPDRVISFDDIKVVGRAYGDLGEHERAFLVWRATTEASYLEDARVGEVLRQRGKVLDGIAYLLDLWREYPSTGVDPERLLRPRAGRRRPRRAGHDRPGDPRRARRRRSHPVGPAPAGDPARPGVPHAVAQEPPGRRGQPGDRRRVPRPGGLRLRREALATIRRALSEEHLPGQLPVLGGARAIPPRRV